MTSQELSVLAPLTSPLPPPPEGNVLTTSQWTTLMAIADTVIPALRASSTPSRDRLSITAADYATAIDVLNASQPSSIDSDLPQTYLSENASSVPGFEVLMHRILNEYMNQDSIKGIRILLSALDTRAGCLLTTGSTTSFHLQSVNVRHQVLQNWLQSYIPPLRQGAKGLSLLFKSAWLKQSPTIGRILGFPRAPVHGKPGKGFDYSFTQFPPGSDAEVLETDVVIVGSGCGGSVCAKNLSEAGSRVVVVDKAYHFPPEHLPMSEADAGVHLFMNGGTEASDDNSIIVIAGQAWGGGGTINWSASLQTQGFVRKEWADGGLPFFTSSDFQTSLDRVCHLMGVSANQIEHNKTNDVLLEGARKLGYSVKPVPQNTAGKRHYCGYCTLGCGSAEKQGPVVSTLPAAEKAGAHFIEGFNVESVLFEQVKGKKTAIGVRGTWRSRDGSGGVSGPDKTTRTVIIKSKRVIVSAGTLQSPLLLLRSGLSNPQIGRNLKLHPVTLVGATFPERVNPWEGGILTAVVDEFQNLDTHGHGTKLEAMTMLPSWYMPFMPWTSGLDFKLFCAKFKHMTGFISLARDRDSGRVYPDPTDGRCRIQYSPSAYDRSNMLEGILALAKICYVSGATEIFTATASVPTFVRQDTKFEEGQPEPGINDVRFQAWLAEIKKKGLFAPDTCFGSAHQMGTCRMGSSPGNSVVDSSGKVWGTEGLYMADASIFPSASGVNPMVTNMAISDWISRKMARNLRKEERLGEGPRL